MTGNLYDTTLNSLKEGFQLISFDWRYLDVNDAVVKQGKYPREELIGYTMMEKYPGIETTPMFAKLQQCMEERTPERIENEFTFPDGSTGWFELTIRPVPEGIFILSMDITDRKAAEEKIHILNEVLEQKVAERTAQLEQNILKLKENEEQLKILNKELESFSYSVSHDLRAPLRAVNGYAQILTEDYAANLDEEGNRIIEAIKYNATKMGTLIDDLLSFSRLGRKEIQKTDIDMNQLMEGVLMDISRSITHTAKISIAHLHPIAGDYSLIQQVMFNLLSNAIKYSSKKENPMVEVSSEKKNKEIIYAVKDNGVGFDMQFADKLFGVFQRLHKTKDFEGTGVGLATVQRIVNKQGGRVWAEAELDKGATFYFSLPNP